MSDPTEGDAEVAYLNDALAGVREVADWYVEQIKRLAPTPPGHESYGETEGDGADYCACGHPLGIDAPPEEVERRWIEHRLATENDAATLNVREAARRLAVHENTIRNWVADGLLADARVPGTSFIRLRLAEVESMTAHRHTAEVEAVMVAAREAIENLRATVAQAETFLGSCVIPPAKP